MKEKVKQLIKEAADKFLGWPVPTSVRPDNLNKDGWMMPNGSGTNLLDAKQAEEMFEYCAGSAFEKLSKELEEVKAELADSERVFDEVDKINDTLLAQRKALKEELRALRDAAELAAIEMKVMAAQIADNLRGRNHNAMAEFSEREASNKASRIKEAVDRVDRFLKGEE